MVVHGCSGSTKKTKEPPKPEEQVRQHSTTDDVEEVDPEVRIPVEMSEVERIQLLKDFHSGKRKFDFYASFTEPFWTFYFFENQVMFVSAESDVPDVTTLEYPFSDKEDTQALRFFMNGEYWVVEISKGEGSDGMSDINYPYIVKLDMLEGGGAINYRKEESK